MRWENANAPRDCCLRYTLQWGRWKLSSIVRGTLVSELPSVRYFMAIANVPRRKPVITSIVDRWTKTLQTRQSAEFLPLSPLETFQNQNRRARTLFSQLRPSSY